jgi:hypothetical protein
MGNMGSVSWDAWCLVLYMDGLGNRERGKGKGKGKGEGERCMERR